MPPLPLDGVRVIDLAALIPGPFAAQILADLGAEVISIEPPAGDLLRHLPGNAYPAVNRNKRGIVLDLKSDEGLEDFLGLAAQADVVIEGFRPGVADRLGVGYEAIRLVNQAVVYCSISGYGQSGPKRLAPGHDLSYIAASGLLGFTGHWGEQGRRMGAPVADFTAASYAAISILALLLDRVRSGVGGYLDVAIAETSAALAALRGGAGANFDGIRQPHLFPANDVYMCADGERIGITAIEDHFWQALCDALIDENEQFGRHRDETLAERLAAGDTFDALLRQTFAARPCSEWLAKFADTDIPVSAVLTLADASNGEQARERGLFHTIDEERHVRFPVLRDGLPLGRLDRSAPELGADNAAILGRLAHWSPGRDEAQS